MGETCGKRIRKLRMQSGMSQEELAGKLNVSMSAVGMYEQSRREPRGSALVAIAKVFGVSTDYLLTGTEYIGREQESDLDRSADELAVLLRKVIKVVCAQVGKEFVESLSQNMGLLKDIKNE